MMSSSTVDTVTIDRLEYDSLLRDSALAEKVRGMASNDHAVLAYSRPISGSDTPPWRWAEYEEFRSETQYGRTPEEALGVGEVQNGE